MAFNQIVRFSHTHIMGGSGHGKTQLLQSLIYRDITANNCSVVVIDSQGDLIRTLSQLQQFDPGRYQSMADRLIIIDPHDMDYVPAINLFDASRIDGYDKAQRASLLAGTISLYEYFFQSLLGADLTQKQGMLFRFLAQLMLAIPGATLKTLHQVTKDPKAYKPHFAKLSGTTREFFEDEFLSSGYKATLQQISRRLWGIRSDATFDNLFSAPQTKINFFDALNSGKIIFINTAKDLLKEDGCSIFGRFFIAMLMQATMERAVIEESKRKPAFIVIDEAQDYFDTNVEVLLSQARKYRVGITLAHQSLSQLSSSLQASIMANTAIKFMGGLSYDDAKTMAKELRCTPEFLESMQKTDTHTVFANYIRNQTATPMPINVELGAVNRLPQMSDTAYHHLLTVNCNRYYLPVSELHSYVAKPVQEEVEVEQVQKAEPVSEPKPADKEATIKPVYKAPTEISKAPVGGGGQKHQRIQRLVKKAGHERSYKVSFEYSVLDGAGKVDVLLEKEETKIACEISITTNADHEAGNIRKCLAAGYEHVWMVSSSPKQLIAIRKLCEELTEDQQACLEFLTPGEVVAKLDSIDAGLAETETTVKGYKVKVSHEAGSVGQSEESRATIRTVIANSFIK